MAPNAGFDAGLGKRSKVARLAYAWKGAEKVLKERRLTSTNAVHEGRQLFDALWEKLSKEGAKPGDLSVALVFVKPENPGEVSASLVIFETGDPHPLVHDLEAMRDHLLETPIGFVVCVWERNYRDYITHTRPLILEKQALELLDSIAEKAPEIEGWRMLTPEDLQKPEGDNILRRFEELVKRWHALEKHYASHRQLCEQVISLLIQHKATEAKDLGALPPEVRVQIAKTRVRIKSEFSLDVERKDLEQMESRLLHQCSSWRFQESGQSTRGQHE